MKKLHSLLGIIVLASILSCNQSPEPTENPYKKDEPIFKAKPVSEKVEPAFWWTDMPVDELQILLYGSDFGRYEASINYPGVRIKKQVKVDSPNYLFLYLDITSRAKAGKFNITLDLEGDQKQIPYELKERDSRDGKNQGFDASDVIYLMMPDRFANGNPDNDTIAGMLESADRSNPERRQGGDIQGIMNNLDYIYDLGMTAVWFTPLFENDMTPDYGAYHGYAATDMYRVDRRYGSNEDYKELIDVTHKKGMKVIMDMIHNHIGDQHWWMNDLPTSDWISDWDTHGQSSFRGSVASDPYASEYDKDKLTKSWFNRRMPDLNNRNELLADYLIQNTLWWIEYSGVDGIRMDTYVYPDKDYMARWAKEVLEAYPDFNIVGEVWVNKTAIEPFWQYDPEGVDDGYNSHLPSVTDFPFALETRQAMNENFGWLEGLRRLYYIFAQDMHYSDPMQNVIFLDNHDMGRIYEQVGKNEAHFKMLYAFLMTARGIPQVYYGTELMMEHENKGGDDEGWRQTMPGGFPGDDRSVFTAEGRTDKENEIMEYVTALTKWRKTAVATHEGRLLHFVPENDIYVYFRIHEDQTVMIVMNNNEESVMIDKQRFSEVLDSFSLAENVITGEQISVDGVEAEGKTTSIFELKNK